MRMMTFAKRCSKEILRDTSIKAGPYVKVVRDGKTIFYSLADSHVATIMNQGLEHVTEE